MRVAHLSVVCLVSIFFSIAIGPSLAAAQTNAKDHPLVSRFQGSDVLEYKASEFDEVAVPMGPITGENSFTKTQRVEGKVTKFRYSMPPNRSGLEVIRSYQTALERGGFQILFKCDGSACISDKFNKGYTNATTGIWCVNCEEPMRYVAAKLPRPSGDAYVAVVVEKDKYEGGTWLTIVEEKPMGTGTVTVNAAAIATGITQTGHFAVYGIYFDTGKAELKPESKSALDEIAKLLGMQPALKLHVVGHTDNVGTLAANTTLSKQRADAVVNALATTYKIAPARLIGNGVGPLAPVAPNATDEGRAKNRRVELVPQ